MASGARGGRIIFGEIPGHPVGTCYGKYRDMYQAGVHRQTTRGISGPAAEGADSIVLNGGYKDDRDEGPVIYYTGEGGQDSSGNQIANQDPASSGNASLQRSYDTGLPVRVIRGSKGNPIYSPPTGYRYDGLYRVTSVQTVRSTDGPWVLEFKLELIAVSGAHEGAMP